jgi:hypothetical protein
MSASHASLNRCSTVGGREGALIGDEYLPPLLVSLRDLARSHDTDSWPLLEDERPSSLTTTVSISSPASSQHAIRL